MFYYVSILVENEYSASPVSIFPNVFWVINHDYVFSNMAWQFFYGFARFSNHWILQVDTGSNWSCVDDAS